VLEQVLGRVDTQLLQGFCSLAGCGQALPARARAEEFEPSGLGGNGFGSHQGRD
jgi:hypothetical protein